MIKEKIKVLFVSLFGISLVFQNLQSNEIRTNIISKDTYRFETSLDTKDIIVEYFDRQMPSQNISKWLTWYENDFFDTSNITNYAIKTMYCSYPQIYNVIRKKQKILIINRTLVGDLEMILIDDCDIEKEVNKLK